MATTPDNKEIVKDPPTEAELIAELVDVNEGVDIVDPPERMAFIKDGIFQYIGDDEEWDDLKIPAEDFDMIRSQYDISMVKGKIVYSKSARHIEERTAYLNAEKDRLIQEEKNKFQKTIEDFLSQYPKAEQETFTKKELLANKVLAGGDSIYINKKVLFYKEKLGIDVTPEFIAQSIIAKSEPWEEKYADLENERDWNIIMIEKNYEDLISKI